MAYFLTAGHLAALAATVILSVVLSAGLRFSGGRAWTWSARLLGVTVVANEIWYEVSMVQAHTWRIDHDLPLYLCDVAAFVAGVALWWPRPLLIEVTYFWGLAGTLQGLITPDIDPPFPSYAYLQFYIDHVGVVAAAVILVTGMRRTPRPHSILRMTGLTAAFTAVVGVADIITGGNYMYLRHTPYSGSLLDYMGPWPWYIVSGVVLGTAFITILDAPFWRRRRMSRISRRPSPTTPASTHAAS